MLIDQKITQSHMVEMIKDTLIKKKKNKNRSVLRVNTITSVSDKVVKI